MKKLGLIGRWREFPAAGLTIEGDGVREVEIRFNTMERTIVTVEELQLIEKSSPDEKQRGGEEVKGRRIKPARKALLGVVNGLETYSFRAVLPCVIRAEQQDEKPSTVFYQTEAGQNYAIDGEHLRDFTVPFMGRMERNPELDQIRFEFKQQLREMGGMLGEFAAFKRQMEMAKNGQGSEANGNPDKEPRPASRGAGRGDKPLGQGAEGDAGRSPSPQPEVQPATDEGDTGGSPPEDTGVRRGADKASG